MLIASRVVQAVAAATLTPQVLAIIRVEFAPHERPFAIGLYGTSMGFAAIVAQLLGGLLVSMDLFGLSWRPIFLINLPIGLAAICLGTWLLHERRGTARPTLDLPGVGLISLALFLLIYPLVEGREHGWPAWSFLMLAATLPVMQASRSASGRSSDRVARHWSRCICSGFRDRVRAGGLRRVLLGPRGVLRRADGVPAGGAGLVRVRGGHDVPAVRRRLLLHLVVCRPDHGAPRRARPRAGFGADGACAARGVASISATPDPRALALLFLVYGVGQGLAQPALISTVLGGAGVGGEDAGAASGLFLTTAQSSLALGVAAIGDVFFARLGAAPNAQDYAAALADALACNLALQAATFLLVLRS